MQKIITINIIFAVVVKIFMGKYKKNKIIFIEDENSLNNIVYIYNLYKMTSSGYG